MKPKRKYHKEFYKEFDPPLDIKAGETVIFTFDNPVEESGDGVGAILDAHKKACTRSATDLIKFESISAKQHVENLHAAKAVAVAAIELLILEERKKAKKENARDFSAVVKSFNNALDAAFDRPSIQTLRLVINGADARANYVDLPEQSELQAEIKSLEREK